MPTSFIVSFLLLFAVSNPSLARAEICARELLGGALERIEADFVRSRLALVEAFWSEDFGRRGWVFEPADLKFVEAPYPIGGGLYYEPQRTPVYWISEKRILIGAQFFHRAIVGSATDALVTYAIAHEIGHHVQNLRGVFARLKDKRAKEDQADCLAGVFFGRLLALGRANASHIRDVKQRLVTMHRPVNVPSLRGLGPGRKAWFMNGYYRGLHACERIIPL